MPLSSKDNPYEPHKPLKAYEGSEASESHSESSEDHPKGESQDKPHKRSESHSESSERHSKRKASGSKMLRAKRPFISHVGGKRLIVNEGLVVASDNPSLKGLEHLFEEVEDDVERVERATANPGERRNVQISKAKKK